MDTIGRKVRAYIIISLLSMVTVWGIMSLQQDAEKVQQELKKHPPTPEQYLPGYKVVVIDSCEYIEWQGTYQALYITHKGNCKNPIHKNKQEGTCQNRKRK